MPMVLLMKKRLAVSHPVLRELRQRRVIVAGERLQDHFIEQMIDLEEVAVHRLERVVGFVVSLDRGFVLRIRRGRAAGHENQRCSRTDQQHNPVELEFEMHGSPKSLFVRLDLARSRLHPPNQCSHLPDWFNRSNRVSLPRKSPSHSLGKCLTNRNGRLAPPSPAEPEPRQTRLNWQSVRSIGNGQKPAESNPSCVLVITSCGRNASKKSRIQSMPCRGCAVR
jgi:hypothetical protein